eukprot:219140-Pelagomonas_calceolata.AAC.6
MDGDIMRQRPCSSPGVIMLDQLLSIPRRSIIHMGLGYSRLSQHTSRSNYKLHTLNWLRLHSSKFFITCVQAGKKGDELPFPGTGFGTSWASATPTPLVHQQRPL